MSLGSRVGQGGVPPRKGSRVPTNSVGAKKKKMMMRLLLLLLLAMMMMKTLKKVEGFHETMLVPEKVGPPSNLNVVLERGASFRCCWRCC